MKIEIAVNDEYVEPAVKALTKAARTGEVGDGKIFILDLKECIRIRTGERDQPPSGESLGDGIWNCLQRKRAL